VSNRGAPIAVSVRAEPRLLAAPGQAGGHAREEPTRQTPVAIEAVHRGVDEARIPPVRLDVCYDRSMAAPDVLTEILLLPAEQRARLALELIRSLDREHDADADACWDEEIERRAAEVEAGTASTMTLDEYRGHIRARRAARARR
jgi:putative addiction module component (TIGR02574 family)